MHVGIKLLRKATGIFAPVVLSLAMFAAAGCRAAETPLRAFEGTREITARMFRVLRVVDGDTFKIRYDGDVVSVRIWGIDAPEMNAPGGPASKEALARLIDDREIRLVFSGPRRRDHFGRLLARVFVGDLEVGPEMIRSGHAKPYEGRRR